MRVLVLDHGLLARDSAQALRREGHEVHCLPPGRGAVLEELKRAELLLSINLNASLARAARHRKIPYVAWVVDPRVSRATLEEEREAASEHTWVFSYERAQIPLYRSLGYARVEHLPTGASDAFCVPGASSEGFPVGFVGTSLLESTNEFVPFRRSLGSSKDPAAQRLRELMDRCLETQREELAEFLLPARLETLERELRVHVISEGWTDPKWEFVMTLAKESARDHRLAVCRALAPLGLSVWGPPDWGGALEPGMAYAGSAPYPGGALRAYRSCAVNLNVTRIYAGDAVPNRVWDVLACGGFLLSDFRPELLEHFGEGEGPPCFRTPAEAFDLAHHYLDHPVERRALAERGRAAVLKRHTLSHRIRHILERLASAL